MLHVDKITAVLLILFVSLAYAYERSDHPHWIDADGDGQETLIRDSLVDVSFPR